MDPLWYQKRLAEVLRRQLLATLMRNIEERDTLRFQQKVSILSEKKVS